MGARTLDVDTQAVVTILRRAIEQSGLNQKQYAAALGTSPSRLSAYLHGITDPSASTLMRCVRMSAGLSAARDEHVPTPIDCAETLRRTIESGARPSTVLRFALELRDRVRDTLENRPHLADAWEGRASTGDTRWDTLIAALVRHEFARAERTAPQWTQTPALDEDWLPVLGRQSTDQVRDSTPDWLHRQRIYIADSALAVV